MLALDVAYRYNVNVAKRYTPESIKDKTMTLKARTFTVSCNHVSPDWQRDQIEVAVKPYDDRDAETLWYVSIAGFGCSKNYTTPEAAIRGMLQDHACTDIRITEVTPDPADDAEVHGLVCKVSDIQHPSFKSVVAAKQVGNHTVALLALHNRHHPYSTHLIFPDGSCEHGEYLVTFKEGLADFADRIGASQ